MNNIDFENLPQKTKEEINNNMSRIIKNSKDRENGILNFDPEQVKKEESDSRFFKMLEEKLSLENMSDLMNMASKIFSNVSKDIKR
jgi:hypothetical protein